MHNAKQLALPGVAAQACGRAGGRRRQRIAELQAELDRLGAQRRMKRLRNL